jgi:hypothetical protein
MPTFIIQATRVYDFEVEADDEDLALVEHLAGDSEECGYDTVELTVRLKETGVGRVVAAPMKPGQVHKVKR